MSQGPRRPSPLAETRIDGEKVFHGRLLHVHRDRVRLPDGSETGREYIVHPGAVAVVPLLPDGQVILLRQFRYPVGQEFIEIPAGKLDAGEDVEACGRRELAEETGWRAGRMRHLLDTHPCIGYADERIALYLATELSPGDSAADDDEFLEVFHLPLPEAVALVRAGAITDAKTVIGLLYVAGM